MKTIARNPNHIFPTAVKNQPERSFSHWRRRKALLALVVLGAGLLAAHARADALTGFYTQVAVGDPDFGSGPNAGWILGTGMVQGQLGPNGLPVLSSDGVARLGTSADMNATTHELLWWSPGANPYVSYDLNPIRVDSAPLGFGYPNTDWYATGETGDDNYFRTVHWQGTFNLASAGQISLSLSVDDDVWLYIDGTLVTEDHYGYEADVNPSLSAGSHLIDLFYDDRFPVYNAINFSSSEPISPTVAPEPGSIALFATGALCLLARGRGRQKRNVRS